MSEKVETLPLLEITHETTKRCVSKDKKPPTCAEVLAAIISLVLVFWFCPLTSSSSSEWQLSEYVMTKRETFINCILRTYPPAGSPYIDPVAPLPIVEFVERRDRLAQALAANSIDAFVAEPGYTFHYYNNISQADWEPWEPEERPFLTIIKPRKDTKTGLIKADTFFLAPSFEVERVRLLGMPFEDSFDIVGWQEHWNPYQTLLESEAFNSSIPRNLLETKDGSRRPVIMVDDEMRDFIQRGLSENGFKVIGLSEDVERIRQTKSAREVEILRTVNSVTVEALRGTRQCLISGLTEEDVRKGLDGTLYKVGLKPFFNIVLFDENASNPHGGTNGSMVLEDETLILIDVGAHLHGYSSDITRTFFPPYVPRPNTTEDYENLSPSMKKKLKIWNIVHKAQTASIASMLPNNTAASVDIAARDIIDAAGYGDAFTHRLGHGIGIKAHESPYLNKGNTNTTLHPGMAFTSEPGIYLVGEFGVRLEDVLLVRENGDGDEGFTHGHDGGRGGGDDALGPSVLSGIRARGPWDP